MLPFDETYWPRPRVIMTHPADAMPQHNIVFLFMAANAMHNVGKMNLACAGCL